MSARDVIATTLAYISPHGAILADVILADLTAAGWTVAPPGSRVVPEGGVDAETELRKAVHAVQDATAAYLPPDGIGAQECLNRILQATDNPTINAITLGAQYGRP